MGLPIQQYKFGECLETSILYFINSYIYLLSPEILVKSFFPYFVFFFGSSVISRKASRDYTKGKPNIYEELVTSFLVFFLGEKREEKEKRKNLDTPESKDRISNSLHLIG